MKKQPSRTSSWRKPTDPKSGKPYSDMTTAELREATREFDEPMAAERMSRAMTPAERAAYRQALKAGARNGRADDKQVLITVESKLLRRADAYAKRRKMTRSELVAHSLETVIGSKT